MSFVEDMQQFEDKTFSYSKYAAFADIPDELKTQLGAGLWLKAMKTTGIGKFVDYFEQIPKAFLSQGLLKFVVQWDVRLLANIDPSDSPDYAELCLEAFKRSYLAANYFHEDFRTAQTVASLMKGMPSVIDSVFEDVPWIMGISTPDLIEAAALSNLYFMAGLPDEQISDAALSKHLAWDGNFQALRANGKLHLAAKHLKTGAWPEPLAKSDPKQPKPRTLESAFNHMLSKAMNSRQALYMANLMTYPIEEVMPLIQTRQHVSMAMEMYSAEDLKPFMKTNRHLKAAILEESLGL
jgi:hypothetical protein